MRRKIFLLQEKSPLFYLRFSMPIRLSGPFLFPPPPPPPPFFRIFEVNTRAQCLREIGIRYLGVEWFSSVSLLNFQVPPAKGGLCDLWMDRVRSRGGWSRGGWKETRGEEEKRRTYPSKVGKPWLGKEFCGVPYITPYFHFCSCPVVNSRKGGLRVCMRV